MTNAIIVETVIGARPGVGVLNMYDATTGHRLYAALYGRPLFYCDREAALAVITDYAAKHGIVIVETQAQTEETTE